MYNPTVIIHQEDGETSQSHPRVPPDAKARGVARRRAAGGDTAATPPPPHPSPTCCYIKTHRVLVCVLCVARSSSCLRLLLVDIDLDSGRKFAEELRPRYTSVPPPTPLGERTAGTKKYQHRHRIHNLSSPQHQHRANEDAQGSSGPATPGSTPYQDGDEGGPCAD